MKKNDKKIMSKLSREINYLRNEYINNEYSFIISLGTIFLDIFIEYTYNKNKELSEEIVKKFFNQVAILAVNMVKERFRIEFNEIVGGGDVKDD